MRIVSIVSSGRKSGNTERIVRRMEEELLNMAAEKNIKIELEQIHLGSLDIKFCRGCRVCFDKGEELCPLKDDFLSIRDKISQADGIILASPVYVEDINGIMKNWIDRMAFNCHRPAFAGKTAVIITTSGGGSTNHALRTMKSALIAWGFGIPAQSKFRTGALMEDEQINLSCGSKIKASAGKLFNTINNKRGEKPSFYSLVVFKVQQKFWQKAKEGQTTYDYLYWKNNGWIEKSCSYYIYHKSNPIKIKFAGIVGNMVSLFFI